MVRRMEPGREWRRPMGRVVEHGFRARYCFALIAAVAMFTAPARAQWIDCPPPSTLIPIPELVSSNGVLSGTIILGDEQQRLTFRQPPQSKPGQAGTTTNCAPQHVRTLRGQGAVPAPPAPNGSYPDPVPGPTLRARVGDIVQLTFVNQIDAVDFPYSIDRGETRAPAAAATRAALRLSPAATHFPTASTARAPATSISTARTPIPNTHRRQRASGSAAVAARDRAADDHAGHARMRSDFFKACERNCARRLSTYPQTWKAAPLGPTCRGTWTAEQDPAAPGLRHAARTAKLWARTRRRSIGTDSGRNTTSAPTRIASELPQYTASVWPPPPGSTSPIMGQSPGTHWYHAHKHGSTAINVANGMTGAFIIEGQYDDDAQHVLRHRTGRARSP